MLDLFNNKIAFLKKEPKMGWFFVLIIILILLSLLHYICKKEIYDCYQTKGIATCTDECILTSAIPTTIHFDHITMNQKNLDYEMISKELKIDEENYQTYYEITLSIKNNLSNNEIVDLNVYYHKQRLIIKIIDQMF